MADIPTLANGAAPPTAPPAADPGAQEPAVAAPERQSFAQQRHAQEQARAQTKPPANPEAPAPVADPEQATPDAEKIKIGKYEVSEEELGSIMERQALDDLRKATVPAAPEAYEAKLPADLKLPGGQQFQFDTSDPSLVAARNLAHA